MPPDPGVEWRAHRDVIHQIVSPRDLDGPEEGDEHLPQFVPRIRLNGPIELRSLQSSTPDQIAVVWSEFCVNRESYLGWETGPYQTYVQVLEAAGGDLVQTFEGDVECSSLRPGESVERQIRLTLGDIATTNLEVSVMPPHPVNRVPATETFQREPPPDLQVEVDELSIVPASLSPLRLIVQWRETCTTVSPYDGWETGTYQSVCHVRVENDGEFVWEGTYDVECGSLRSGDTADRQVIATLDTLHITRMVISISTSPDLPPSQFEYVWAARSQ